MYRSFLKRIIDILVSSLILLIFSPLLIILSLFLALANRGTPFFFQRRPGKDGRIFVIVKFKTMNDKKGSDGRLLPDAERLTFVGKLIRKTSLDELPQLFNVFIGDMSLIGPRPLLPEYVPLYSAEQNRRHEVKPGITGWAQVNGRNAISWDQKFKLDVWYVDRVSFKLDLKIIWLTVLKVVKSEGINAQNEATMTRFEGN